MDKVYRFLILYIWINIVLNIILGAFNIWDNEILLYSGILLYMGFIIQIIGRSERSDKGLD